MHNYFVVSILQFELAMAMVLLMLKEVHDDEKKLLVGLCMLFGWPILVEGLFSADKTGVNEVAYLKLFYSKFF
jgi:hypothetical protein